MSHSCSCPKRTLLSCAGVVGAGLAACLALPLGLAVPCAPALADEAADAAAEDEGTRSLCGNFAFTLPAGAAMETLDATGIEGTLTNSLLFMDSSTWQPLFNQGTFCRIDAGDGTAVDVYTCRALIDSSDVDDANQESDERVLQERGAWFAWCVQAYTPITDLSYVGCLKYEASGQPLTLFYFSSPHKLGAGLVAGFVSMPSGYVSVVVFAFDLAQSDSALVLIDEVAPTLEVGSGYTTIDMMQSSFAGQFASHDSWLDSLSNDEGATPAPGPYADGSYESSASGRRGPVASLTIEDGKVTGVSIASGLDVLGYATDAIEQLSDAIVAANGTEGVDTVSGATITSRQILSAANDCLEQAHAAYVAEVEAQEAAERERAAAEEKAAAEQKAAEEEAAAQAPITYVDGTYTAEGKGIGGKVPVTVTIKDGKIASVEVGDNSETQGIGSKAIEQLPDEIAAANGLVGVDAVSGASVTSKAIFTAVQDCLVRALTGEVDEVAEPAAEEEAEAADTTGADVLYADGEYTAEGKGIGGKVPVTVTIKDGKIASVEVGDNSETQGIGSKAIEQLPDEIAAANGLVGVDAVSGASVTSKAIFTAVQDCLEQAGA